MPRPSAGARMLVRVVIAILIFTTIGIDHLAEHPRAAFAASTHATDDVRLRSGPGTKYHTIDVIPYGTSLKITGSYAHGFYPVRFDGQKGWVSDDYLAMPRPLGVARTTDDVRLRAGPSIAYAILLTVPGDASVTITGSLNKGFYPVRFQGFRGWLSADYLQPGKKGGAVQIAAAVARPRAIGLSHTMDTLNLRAQPSGSGGVILVMPKDATVTITGSYNNGYYPVRYEGTKGWASADYLAVGAESAASGGWTRAEIVDLIFDAAWYYGQSGADMLRVAQCESNLDPDEVTPPHSASGLFQFLSGTWKTTPYGDRSVFDPEANAYATAWMWSVGRKSEWVCQ